MRGALKQFIPNIEVAEKRNLLLANGTCPADIYVPAFSHGLNYAIDVTVITPFQPRFMSKLSNVLHIGCVAQAGADDKIKKYQESCNEVGLMFIPFALDAFGGYSSNAQSFIKLLSSLYRSKTALSFKSIHQKLRDRIAHALQTWMVNSLTSRIQFTDEQSRSMFEM